MRPLAGQPAYGGLKPASKLKLAPPWLLVVALAVADAGARQIHLNAQVVEDSFAPVGVGVWHISNDVLRCDFAGNVGHGVIDRSGDLACVRAGPHDKSVITGVLRLRQVAGYVLVDSVRERRLNAPAGLFAQPA